MVDEAGRRAKLALAGRGRRRRSITPTVVYL
jgi:hypothetical protein